jgi:L1 cell adhesion molecule like protein
MSTASKYVIGIDLGTTYSCVGTFQNDRVEIISNDQGNRTTPSWVAFNDKERLVGDAAKNQATMNPENTIFDAKRFIGRKYDDPSIAKEIAHLSCKVINKSNKPYFEVKYKDEIKIFSPEEVSAMVLGKMKEIAEAYIGESAVDCVITVPAYFNDACRQATKDAGTIAGLNVLRIINEPTAAAIAYGLDKCQDGKEKNILVYDFGGGTFDVSLLNISDGCFEVLATAGDVHLGGEDLDQIMVEYCLGEYKKKYKEDISSEKRVRRRLHAACERAKRTLSSSTTATIEIDSLYKGNDFLLTITRAKFESLVGHLLSNTMKPVEQVLEDAKLSKHQIDEIVLVGGSTRIPKVQQLLKDYFNKEPCTGINPDECVAYGATIQASILGGIKSDKTSNILLLDCIPLTIGIETSGDVATPMLKRGTTIPAKKTQTFSTYADNQTEARIVILEGERYRSKDNNILGSFQLEGIPPAPRGIPQIHVTYDINANGILNVTAEVENAQGAKKSLEIQNDRNRLSQEEIDRMIAEAEKYKADDEKLKETKEAMNMYETLLYSTKTNLPQEDKEELREFKKKIDEELDWCTSHQNASKEEITHRQEQFQEYVKENSEAIPQPPNGQMPFNPNTTTTDSSEPSIEEVD